MKLTCLKMYIHMSTPASIFDTSSHVNLIRGSITSQHLFENRMETVFIPDFLVVNGRNL